MNINTDWSVYCRSKSVETMYLMSIKIIISSDKWLLVKENFGIPKIVLKNLLYLMALNFKLI